MSEFAPCAHFIQKTMSKGNTHRYKVAVTFSVKLVVKIFDHRSFFTPIDLECVSNIHCL